MKPVIVATAAIIAAYGGATKFGPPRTPVAPLPAVELPATTRQSELREEMRKLWTDHVVWTRSYIIAATGGEPDAVEAGKRLMKNQEEIGDAVAVYYGRPAGDRLATLLKEHIAEAGDLIKAMKSGDKAAQRAADKRWHRNAESIADLLANANPAWRRGMLVRAMNTHLATTTDEITARLNRDWGADVTAYDRVYDHILRISDSLADGIAHQFPAKVTADR